MMEKYKAALLVILITLFYETANAQHRHHRPYYSHYYPHRIVTVAAKPKVTSHVCNRFNQKERLAMAIAYLESHEQLTIKQYAKMTLLNMDSAEAELDAFAMDMKKPILLVINGKKKVYIKR